MQEVHLPHIPDNRDQFKYSKAVFVSDLNYT